MIALFSKFYGKSLVGFCLSMGKTHFLRGLILKLTGTALVVLINGTKDFQKSPPFERLARF